jgi:hypothetical protein
MYGRNEKKLGELMHPRSGRSCINYICMMKPEEIECLEPLERQAVMKKTVQVKAITSEELVSFSKAVIALRDYRSYKWYEKIRVHMGTSTDRTTT